jgi:hypothetical protein
LEQLYRTVAAIARPMRWRQIGRVGWITPGCEANNVMRGSGEPVPVIEPR